VKSGRFWRRQRRVLRAGDGSAEMRYRLIDAEKTHHSVCLIARVLGVSRQGYYAWKNRGPSRRARQDQSLTETIVKIHVRSRHTYGALRIRAELRDDFCVCIRRKRVARLMHSARLGGCTGVGGVGCPTVMRRCCRRVIWSTATSPRPRRTTCGRPTSPACPGKKSPLRHLHPPRPAEEGRPAGMRLRRRQRRQT
jgi:hypothetical protein